MPCSLPHGGGDGGEGLGVEVVRRGVDEVAGAVELLGHGGGAREGRLVRRVPGLAAEQRDLGERGLAVLRVLAVLAVLLVGVEGVRAERRALRQDARVGGVGDRQGEDGLLGTGERAGRGTGRAAQRLGTERVVLLRDGSESDGHDDGRLEAGRRGQLRHLALAAGCAEGLQDPGECAVVRLVHGLGTRCDDRALGALRDTDDDRVGPQAGRRGGAESQSSHCGEISLPLFCCGRVGMGRPGPDE